MTARIINTILLLVIAVGLLFAYQADRGYRRVRAQYERIESKVGSFEIKDRSKLHVKAIPTGEPMHFAWRVYIPAGMRFRWQSQGKASSFASNGCEVIVRARIDQDAAPTLTLHTKAFDGHKRELLGDAKLADLLRDRWSQIEVEQLGTTGIVAVGTDDVATLLRLTLPDGIKQEAPEKLDADLYKCVENSLVLIQIGSDDAFSHDEANE